MTKPELIPVEVHDLTVKYQEKPVLWNIDFEVPSGKLVAIVGPNGAGKSTLIKSIMGILEPVSGYVKIFGQPLEEMRKQIAYVPQRESVDWNFPISVRELVMMGRYNHIGLFRRPGKEDRRIVAESLQQVGMESYANRQISQLSGGQQQRVFLARALAQRADIYFMDEPFSGVDAATESAILELLKTLRDNNKTVMVVHHDLHTVSQYFDWVMLLNLHLVAFGSIDKTLTEENLRKTYGGRLNILSKALHLAAQKDYKREN